MLLLYKAWLHLFSLDWPLIVHCVEILVKAAGEYITQVDMLVYITQVGMLVYITQVDMLVYITQVGLLV